MAKESYKAKRNESGDVEEQDPISAAKEKKEHQRDNTKKIAKDAGAIALTAAAGVPEPISEMAVDKIAQNPLVDKALDKVSDRINKNPALSKAVNGLADSKAYGAAKSAISAGSGGAGGMSGAPGAAGGASGGASGGGMPNQGSSMPTMGANFANGGTTPDAEATEPKDASSQITDSLMGGGKTKGKIQSSSNSSSNGDFSASAMGNILSKIPPWLASALLPVLAMFIVLLMSIAVLMTPLYVADGILKDVVSGTTMFFEKLGNFFTFNGFVSNDEKASNKEKAFYEELSKKYEEYKTYSGQPQININLITATLFYNRMAGSDFSEEDLSFDENGNVQVDSSDKSKFFSDAKKQIDVLAQHMIVANVHHYNRQCAQTSSTVETQKTPEEVAKNKKGYGFKSFSTKEITHTVAFNSDGSCIIPSDYTDYTVDYEEKGVFHSNLIQSKFIEDYYSTIIKDSENKSSKVDEIIRGIYSMYNEVGFGNAQYDLGVSGFDVNGRIVSNVKVRLLQGSKDNNGVPIEGEDLVDFQKYILGVTYFQTDGTNTEVTKTQSIVARSFALTRSVDDLPVVGLKEENGQWILSIRNSIDDQVYCNPDLGCWWDDADGTVHTGYNSNAKNNKDPLDKNAQMRKDVNAVGTKVAADVNGKVVSTPYNDTNKQNWADYAAQGMNHFEIIKKDYPGVSTLSSGNSGVPAGSGDYTTWKQYEGPWKDIPMGNSGSTIRQIGCLVTSTAIQLQRSGTKLLIPNFNPGSFVVHLNQNGGFGAGGNFTWNVSSTAPNIRFYGLDIKGTQEERTRKLAELSNQGYYVIIQAKKKQHWVAMDRVEGNTVYMFDPGSKSTDLWKRYPPESSTWVRYFEKLD